MTTCSNCGRDMPGVEILYRRVTPILCAECSGQPSSAEHCCAGDKVVFSHPFAGTGASQTMCGLFLSPDETYTVAGVQITRQSVHLKFDGVRYWFRAEHFERIA